MEEPQETIIEPIEHEPAVYLSINNIYKGDCLNIMPNITPKTVKLVIVDLPYGQTDCAWDVKIDLKKMWKQLKRITLDSGQFVFFTTTKFGIDLINSNPSWFRYDLVWEKQSAVGFLNANVMPLRAHEMIYVFHANRNVDLACEKNIPNRTYAKKVREHITKNYPTYNVNMIDEKIGNQGTRHFIGAFSSSQFGLPTKKSYDKLIEHFKINDMPEFIPYEIMTARSESNNTLEWVYNAQKTTGKLITKKARPIRNTTNRIYGEFEELKHDRPSTTDRYPKSIIKSDYDKEKYHPTQKPQTLCDWIIKSYSNPGDLVLDFTMGGGSTAISCITNNRNYIGIEMDDAIFKTASDRITKYKTEIEEQQNNPITLTTTTLTTTTAHLITEPITVNSIDEFTEMQQQMQDAELRC
jgi:DNA modification methylase